MGFKSITEVICCPICLFAENVEKSLPPSKRCGMCGQIVCQWLSLSIPIFGWWWMLSTHIVLRQQYGQLPPGAKSQDSGCGSNCLKAWFCYPCSSMQIAEFTDQYE